MLCEGGPLQVLVVEDDERVADALVSVLSRQGFGVIRADDGESALELLDASTDLVLLDLTLPDIDGFEVCRQIRMVSDVPVIMVTGRAQLPARITGLQIGADDYIVKPYDLREVLARIEAVMRRRGPDHGAETGRPSVRGFQVDLPAREVTREDGSVVNLTRKEFDLLALFVRRRGSVVARDRILREIWGSSWKGLERSLEVHVGSLRGKLGEPDLIETVRGVGYRLSTRER